MAPSRKGKKNQKKSRSRKSQRGGGAASLSLPQGVDFASRHVNQHGGALLTGAPVGYTGMLPSELRMVARIGGLDDSIAAAAGQRDPDQMPLAVPAQKGGRRRKSARKSRKSKRSSRKSVRKSRKSGRKSARKSARKSGRKSARKSARKSGRKERKSARKSSRKERKSARKSSRKERKSRKQHGGFRALEGAPLSASPSLLPSHLAAKAGTADFSNPLLKA
jgi:hypothetical protein